MKRLIIILLLLVPALTAAQDFTCVKQSSSTYNHPTVKHTAFTVSYDSVSGRASAFRRGKKAN